MKYIIMIFVLLSSCATIDIRYHVVDTEEDLNAIAGYPVWGYAIWEDRLTHKTCDIYLLPSELYLSEECYDAVIAHELRHCDEGHFHLPGQGWEEACD